MKIIQQRKFKDMFQCKQMSKPQTSIKKKNILKYHFSFRALSDVIEIEIYQKPIHTPVKQINSQLLRQ